MGLTTKPDAKPRKMRLYMCGVDWQHDLGSADVTVYESVARLKQMRTCWKECGIVAVDVTFENVRWLAKQDFSIKPAEERKIARERRKAKGKKT